MVEITIFQGIGGLVIGSLTILFYFLNEARKTDKKIWGLIIEKNRIIDGHFLKSVSIISSIAYRRMIKQVPAITKMKGTEFIKLVKQVIEEVTPELSEKSEEEIAESIEKAEMPPPEMAEMIAIREEDRDRIIDLSMLTYSLTELVPSAIGRVVDRMTKAIIGGFLCGLSIATVDLLFSYGLKDYFPLLGMLIIGSGYFYINYGMLEIWRQRILEKRLEDLEKATNLEEMRTCIGEIVEYVD